MILQELLSLPTNRNTVKILRNKENFYKNPALYNEFIKELRNTNIFKYSDIKNKVINYVKK